MRTPVVLRADGTLGVARTPVTESDCVERKFPAARSLPPDVFNTLVDLWATVLLNAYLRDQTSSLAGKLELLDNTAVHQLEGPGTRSQAPACAKDRVPQAK